MAAHLISWNTCACTQLQLRLSADSVRAWEKELAASRSAPHTFRRSGRRGCLCRASLKEHSTRQSTSRLRATVIREHLRATQQALNGRAQGQESRVLPHLPFFDLPAVDKPGGRVCDTKTHMVSTPDPAAREGPLQPGIQVALLGARMVFRVSGKSLIQSSARARVTASQTWEACHLRGRSADVRLLASVDPRSSGGHL